MVSSIIISVSLTSLFFSLVFIIKNKKIRKLLNDAQLKNHNNELENIKLDGKNKQLTLENIYLQTSISEITKMLKSINPMKSDDMRGMFDSAMFSMDSEIEKNKPKYNIDDILDEIAENGISKISKEKMEFLKKNTKK